MTVVHVLVTCFEEPNMLSHQLKLDDGNHEATRFPSVTALGVLLSLRLNALASRSHDKVDAMSDEDRGRVAF